MIPTKYSKTDAHTIDLGTKRILKYPTPTKEFDIAKMTVKGRSPEKSNLFSLEHECSFVMYILKGRGIAYAGDNTFTVKPEDVIFIPKETRFALEGDFEFVTVVVPAFFPAQAEEVQK